MALGFEASVKDGLTATFTYRHFLEHLQVEIERSRRYGRLFSVLFVDVDGFKIHVAKAGVAATDRLLTHLGEQLTGPRARLRVPDMVARRGADTFCILLPETDTSGAEVAARRLVSTIAEADWPQVHPGLTHVTISVGVASFPLHGKTAGALIQAAAMAGHQAQCQGGNRTVVAGVEFTELKEKIASGEATAQEVSRFEALRQDYDNAQAAHTKRRHHRADLALAVRFESQEALIEAYTDDVGAGGLRLVVDGEFGAGQVIDLCVSLPNDPQPVQATAVVVWARRHEHVVGVEFIEMTYADRERIEALVWAMAEPL
jgi:diguanylate cyclase (GGDEF)-like protein